MQDLHKSFDQEVRDLFDQLPKASEFGNGEVAYISYTIFKKVIDNMMNKAYGYGKLEGLEKAADIVKDESTIAY